MHTPGSLLPLLGRAVLNVAGPEIAGDNLMDLLPQVAQHAWDRWSRDCTEAQRRAELEAVLQTPADAFRQAVADLRTELADSRPPEIYRALAAYLVHLPATIRHALRRPTDPTGNTVPPRLRLRRAEDLLPLLPMRLPRFQPGDRPLQEADWELVELLGVGPLGEVWKARNPDRPGSAVVALKFCLDPSSPRILRQEARLLDRLMLQGRHPGIVPLRQIYLGAEPPCLESEYVDAGDLAAAAREWHEHRHGPKPAQIARAVLRLAKILAFAHRLDPPLIHRDLKPANVLVQRQPDGALALRITDLGTGGVAASQTIRQALRATHPNRLLVTAVQGACASLYASPQQMRGAEADPRDDVYALGVIWHQLLTGDLSQRRPEGIGWRKNLLDLGMPAAMVDLLGSCLAENADDRPRNGAALADHLAVLLQERDRPATPAADTATASLPLRLTNAIQLTMALIPAGTFRMGSAASEPERGDDEGPQHDITITRPFYVGIYPVTQRQYEAVMGSNPACFTMWKGGGPDHPVERISWFDANEFCRRLSELPAEKAAGRVYRLPTEAEWEYACRAGTPTPVSTGLTLSAREANFNGNYPYGNAERGAFLERTTRVGSYLPNPFGLYDMHGNVWEWCADWYSRSAYRDSPRYDPQGPATGNLRVVRGGSCCTIGRFCRSAHRFGVAPGNRDHDVGMRVAMVVEGSSG
jgi:formylglycine-generating enzyme required for sulfatase activity